MTTPHVSNRLPRDLGFACVKMAGKVMDEHVMVSCLKRFSFHLCAFLLSWKIFQKLLVQNCVPC